MKVKIYTIENGEDTPAGEIILSNGKLSISPPDSILLKNMLENPVREPKTGRVIDSQENPDIWMKYLYLTYRSAYLRASVPEDDAPQTPQIQKSPFAKKSE